MTDIDHMKTSDVLRHQQINSLIAQDADRVADAAIGLWEKMAIEIISIVGEGGFNSLYERSLFLTHKTFPWIAVNSLPLQTDQRFSELQMSLAGQTPAQASAANRLLLITFTDILAELIGELLTTSILRSAWGSEEFLAGHPNEATDKSGDEKLFGRTREGVQK